jgi:hypothetical protein
MLYGFRITPPGSPEERREAQWREPTEPFDSCQTYTPRRPGNTEGRKPKASACLRVLCGFPHAGETGHWRKKVVLGSLPSVTKHHARKMMALRMMSHRRAGEDLR